MNNNVLTIIDFLEYCSIYDYISIFILVNDMRRNNIPEVTIRILTRHGYSAYSVLDKLDMVCLMSELDIIGVPDAHRIIVKQLIHERKH